MPKGDDLYLRHMLDSAREAVDMVSGLHRAAFDANRMLRLALTHLLQVIGEAARHVSPQFKRTATQVPWNLIVGMRHRLVHDYLNVDDDILWQTVTADLRPLITALESIVNPPAGP